MMADANTFLTSMNAQKNKDAAAAVLARADAEYQAFVDKADQFLTKVADIEAKIAKATTESTSKNARTKTAAVEAKLKFEKELISMKRLEADAKSKLASKKGTRDSAMSSQKGTDESRLNTLDTDYSDQKIIFDAKAAAIATKVSDLATAVTNGDSAEAQQIIKNAMATLESARDAATLLMDTADAERAPLQRAKDRRASEVTDKAAIDAEKILFEAEKSKFENEMGKRD